MNAPAQPFTRSMDQRRAELDAEDDRIWDDLITGRRDEQRLRRSRTNMQFIRDLPPVCRRDGESDRRKADEAVRKLIERLL